ncbi:hypothetical protein RAS1_36910 [Phycisphaerae bacterium RAS1]|nr:hypothetical protein RAS1_36910 [Phycisphaerae bacterium RAS1]
MLGLGAVILPIRDALERRRLRLLEAAAERLGMAFSQKGEHIIEQPFAALPLFSLGRERKATAVLANRMVRGDRQTFVFDYSFVTGHGKGRHTHRQTVAAVRLGRDRVPHFTLQPEGLLHSIAAAFGYDDIDLGSSPEFSQHWLLRRPDEDAIRRYFDDRQVHALEAERPLNIEGGGEWLLVYRAESRVAPERIGEFIEQARGLALHFSRS